MSLSLDKVKKAGSSMKNSNPSLKKDAKAIRPWETYAPPKDLIEIITERDIIKPKRVNKKNLKSAVNKSGQLEQEKALQDRIQSRAKELFNNN